MNRFTFVFLLLILASAPANGLAQEACTLGKGKPYSSSKTVLTQVAHDYQQSNEQSQERIDNLLEKKKFAYTAHPIQVEILKRSGVLTLVRIIGKPDRMWTLDSALNCY